MSSTLEENERMYQPPIAREKREEDLTARHAREKLAHEYLEKLAAFIPEAMAQFFPEASGKPIVDLVLSSAGAQSKIVLRIDHSGRVVDVTDELPF